MEVAQLDRWLNILLACAAALALAVAAWGFDGADITPEWPPEGKKIATERAELPCSVPLHFGYRGLQQDSP